MPETSTSMDSRPDLLAPFRLTPFGPSHHHPPGVTAVIRLGPDPAWLAHSLPPLLRSVDRVILVDRGPDATRESALAMADGLGLSPRLHVLDYPFELSSPGHDHLSTPPDSVHSRVHFHNWAFSHVRTTYALRWDPRLVLTSEGETLLSSFNWQVGRHHVILELPQHPLYVESDRVAYLDLTSPTIEDLGHPVDPRYSYVKGFERELLRFPDGVRTYVLPHGSCLALRNLTGVDSSDAGAACVTPAQARRERHQADAVAAIRAGRWAERKHLFRLEAPSDTHVVDHAATYWTRR